VQILILLVKKKKKKKQIFKNKEGKRVKMKKARVEATPQQKENEKDYTFF
jgi:hypothetical protein